MKVLIPTRYLRTESGLTCIRWTRMWTRGVITPSTCDQFRLSAGHRESTIASGQSGPGRPRANTAAKNAPMNQATGTTRTMRTVAEYREREARLADADGRADRIE